MPTIFEPSDLAAAEKNGVRIAMLANPAMLGSNALQVERIELEPGVRSTVFEAADAERFIYVIRGKGMAQAGGETHPLEPESILWLEKQDSFSLQAEADGLVALLCRAPARE
jgi:quercetin dioxygenase-like cupin family protein